jgi:hypothetical protein
MPVGAANYLRRAGQLPALQAPTSAIAVLLASAETCFPRLGINPDTAP